MLEAGAWLRAWGSLRGILLGMVLLRIVTMEEVIEEGMREQTDPINFGGATCGG